MNIGVIGGGQLGRMLALSGIPLGATFTFLDPSSDACAGATGELIVAPYDDAAGLKKLADVSDVITYEFENVPSATAEVLSKTVPVWPPAGALAVMQDRAREKELFAEVGMPAAAYREVDSDHALRDASEELGFPLVVKTRSEGYDGKGQMVVRDTPGIKGVVDKLGANLIAEEFVEFDREISVIAARTEAGDIAVYPLSENHHREGILRASFSLPDESGWPVAAEAKEYVTRVLEHLNYVGVLAIEMFEKDGKLFGNEIAPRVHNSGHWTIEGAVTSQFENHLRAITGRPLGSSEAIGYAGMVNLIGAIPEPIDVLSIPGAQLHLYGKEPRPGRKVGHITLLAFTREGLEVGLGRLAGVAGVTLPEERPGHK
jgi:5-(carboxyamino)imidazole ribonucleotide synthase